VKQVVHWQAGWLVDRPSGATTPPAGDLLSVLDGMDAAVVAVRTGTTQVVANAAARELYALPDHRPVVVEDLACRVQIFHAHLLRRLGVDELPLIRALSGRPVEADVIVLALDPDRPGEALDPAAAPQGRRLLLRARPLFGAAGEVTGSVCTAHDVTDLHAERVQLTRRTTELAAIHRATRAILTDEDARRAVCEAALGVTGAAIASVFEPDGRGDLVCTTHMGADLLGMRLPQDGPSIIADVFAGSVTRVLQGSSRHLAMDQEALDRVSATCGVPLRAAVWLPVVSRERRCIAVLSLAYAEDVPVHEHLPVLEILAGETAVAIERQDLLRRLRSEASSDGLTGAANRRVWDEQLPRTLAAARRDNARVSVVMLDLDRFKEYNDAYGHPAGDALLRDAVAAWRRRLRSSDLLCRYGGEEFVVLLPGCGLLEARTMAEGLRSVVPNGQTCSAGVAGWDGEESPELLVERVDAALYAAKIAGRDRVRLAS
jgi:diguanylate cyclase (GGDEF)-like protein